MGLKKGMTNNLSGRPAGSLNKVSKDLRLDIIEFLEYNFNEVKKDWQTLDSKEKLMFYRDLLKYALPALQSTNLLFDKPDIDFVIDFSK